MKLHSYKNSSLPVFIILAVFAALALSCSTMLTDEEYAAFVAATEQQESAMAEVENAASNIAELQAEIARLQEMIVSGEGNVEEHNAAILAATTDLAQAMMSLTAANQLAADSTAALLELEESSGSPEWLLLVEAIAGSLLGVRLMRGGSSKGLVRNVPLLGTQPDRA